MSFHIYKLGFIFNKIRSIKSIVVINYNHFHLIYYYFGYYLATFKLLYPLNYQCKLDFKNH